MRSGKYRRLVRWEEVRGAGSYAPGLNAGGLPQRMVFLLTEDLPEIEIYKQRIGQTVAPGLFMLAYRRKVLEFLAEHLHVTIQTISKWERGLSVPDADMLIALSEMFEVSVSTLLNRSINEEDTSESTLLAEKLEQLNLQLAQRNQRSRKVWKVIRLIAIACLVFGILCILLNAVAMKSYQAPEASVVEITES